MSKYYFQTEDSEHCYQLSYFYDLMKKEGIEEMELIVAEKVTINDFFWCKEYQELAERGECSIKFCKKYVPNNGKNGRCKHYGYFFGKTDKRKTIMLFPKLDYYAI